MDSLGESVLNLVVGFITVIINFILTVICIIGDLVITTFDFLATPYKFTMVAKAITIGDLNLVSFCQSCFIPMGIAIAAIIFFLTLYQTALSPIVSGGEKIGRPISIVGRFIVTIIAVVASSGLCDLVFYVAKKFLVGLAKMGNYALGLVTVGDTWSLTETFNNAGAFNGANLGEATAAQSALAEATNLPASVITVASNLAQLLLVGFLMCVIAWNLFQFYIEIFERYAVLIGITSIAPLTIATAASPLTEKIAKSWLSFFMGEIVLWVSQYFSLVVVKVVLGSLDSFQKNFSTGTQGLFVWAGMSYAFINFARHADDYINKLGLTAARTGEGLFKDLGSMVAAGRMVGGVAKTAGNAATGAGRLAGKSAVTAGKAAGTAGKGALLGATQGASFIHSAGASGAEYAKAHGENVAAGAVKGAGVAVAGAAVAGAKNKVSAATSAAAAPIKNARNAIDSSIQKGATAGKNSYASQTVASTSKRNEKDKPTAKNGTSTSPETKSLKNGDGTNNVISKDNPEMYNATKADAAEVGITDAPHGIERSFERTSGIQPDNKDEAWNDTIRAVDVNGEGDVVAIKAVSNEIDESGHASAEETEQFRYKDSNQWNEGQKNEAMVTEFESDGKSYVGETKENKYSFSDDDKYVTAVYEVGQNSSRDKKASFTSSSKKGTDVAARAHRDLHSSRSQNNQKAKEPEQRQSSGAKSQKPQTERANPNKKQMSNNKFNNKTNLNM